MVGPIAATEEVSFGGKVATLATSDITTTLANVNASINWGDGSAATTGTVVADPVGGFDVIGSKTYSRDGQYPVVVAISGAGQTPLTSQGLAVVTPAPLIVTGTSFTATAGQPFGGPVASFQDFGSSDPSDFMATIRWGAGQATTVGSIAAVAGSPGFFSVSGPYTYGSPGVATPTVSVTRISTGQMAQATSTATIIASSLTSSGTSIEVAANTPFTMPVASFLDTTSPAAAGDYAAEITWGPGLPTTLGTIASSPAGLFTITGSFSYSSPGTDQITVNITKTATGQATTATSKAIVSPSLTATGTAVAPTLNQPFTGVVASFFDASPPGTPGEYTAIINWGNSQGPMTPGTVTPVAGSPGHFNVSGNFTYTVGGPFTVVTTITRADTGLSASATTAATVSPAISLTGVPITATAGQSFSKPVATFVDTGKSSSPGDFSATIAWGPGLPTTPAAITSSAAGMFAINGSFIYPGPGQYTPTITVVRLSTGQAVQSTTTAVVASSLVGSGLPVTTTAGESFSGPVATFTDTLSTGTSTNPGGFSATIDWGDGHVTPGLITNITNGSASNTLTVSGTNTYSSPGTFPVAVTVTRLGGNGSLTIPSTALAYRFGGSLDPLGDSGPSDADGITNRNQPTFLGTAEPNAIVRVFGQRSDSTQAIPLGETVAGSDGRWTLTAPPLADGRYQVSGVAVPTTGSPYPPSILTGILIDTLGPRVVGVTTVPNTDQVTVTIRDDRSGINPAGLLDLANYALLGPRNSRAKAIAVVGLPTVAALPSDPMSVVVTFSLSPNAHRGQYKLRIVSGGITDLAGNGLRGGVFTPVLVSKPHPAPRHSAKAAHRR